MIINYINFYNRGGSGWALIISQEKHNQTSSNKQSQDWENPASTKKSQNLPPKRTPLSRHLPRYTCSRGGIASATSTCDDGKTIEEFWNHGLVMGICVLKVSRMQSMHVVYKYVYIYIYIHTHIIYILYVYIDR